MSVWRLPASEIISCFPYHSLRLNFRGVRLLLRSWDTHTVNNHPISLFQLRRTLDVSYLWHYTTITMCVYWYSMSYGIVRATLCLILDLLHSIRCVVSKCCVFRGVLEARTWHIKFPPGSPQWPWLTITLASQVSCIPCEFPHCLLFYASFWWGTRRKNAHAQCSSPTTSYWHQLQRQEIYYWRSWWTQT